MKVVSVLQRLNCKKREQKPMRTRIFCAHAGGQGKTTTAQVIATALKKRGEDINLAAADFIDEEGGSKLGRLFPGEVEELGTGPDVSLAKQVNDLNANIKYWDCLGPLLLKGNYLLDMGANVIDQVLHWGEVRRAPDLLQSRSAPPIDAFLVCKAEQRAVDDMTDLVKRLGSGKSLPVDRIFVVLNEQIGNFDALNIRSKIAEAIDSKSETSVEFLTLPACSSELWVPMEQTYTSILTAQAMEEDQIQEVLGVDFWGVHSGKDDLASWIIDVDANIKASGVL